MKIKDVENQLSITRANIRFYEKEGLLSPKRGDNNYRDYTQGDIETLKKIIVFRKLGFTIEEISKMQKGELSLDIAVDENIRRLEAEIENLKGSLEVAKQIKSEQKEFDNIDQEYYWNVINSEEKNGHKFVDMCKDYLQFEMLILDSALKYTVFFNFEKLRKKHGLLVAFCILLLLCLIRGLSKKFIWHESFLEGFFYPFIVLIVGSIIFLPIFFISRKHPNAAYIIVNILLYIGIIFLAFVFLFLIVLILNAIFRFWF